MAILKTDLKIPVVLSRKSDIVNEILEGSNGVVKNYELHQRLSGNFENILIGNKHCLAWFGTQLISQFTLYQQSKSIENHMENMKNDNKNFTKRRVIIKRQRGV